VAIGIAGSKGHGVTANIARHAPRHSAHLQNNATRARVARGMARLCCHARAYARHGGKREKRSVSIIISMKMAAWYLRLSWDRVADINLWRLSE